MGSGSGGGGSRSKCEIGEGSEKKRKMNGVVEEGEDVSCDGSVGLNYDSDDLTESNNNSKMEEGNNGKTCGNASNGNSIVTGVDQKGKKKGMPAKYLMAERRRRKKLNDRLYMLKFVVPKISKMQTSSPATPIPYKEVDVSITRMCMTMKLNQRLQSILILSYRIEAGCGCLTTDDEAEPEITIYPDIELQD